MRKTFPVAQFRSFFNHEYLIHRNYSSKRRGKPELPSQRSRCTPEKVEIPFVPSEVKEVYKKSIPNVGQPLGEDWEPGVGYVVDQPFKSKVNVKRLTQSLKEEFRLWVQERKNYFKSEPELCLHGEINKMWTFDKPGCLTNFAMTNDSEHDFGYSTCTLGTTTNGTLLFKGNLSTSIKDDGNTVRSGFCAFRTPRAKRSFNRRHFYDWGMYTHVVLKVRGDGRYYLINLGQDDELDFTWYDMQSYFLFTRGGPYWQTIKIPFSKFVCTHKGKIQDRQPDVMPGQITFVGVTLCDDVDGPFQLEIEYIGTMYDLNHMEESAYEEYENDTPAFNVT